MRRWYILISLLLIGCMQQPAQPSPTALPEAAVLPTQAVPATLRAPTTEPTLQPSSVPTASFASATPTIEAPPTSTPISAPPFTAPVDLIVAGLDISRTTIIISQLYGDSETSPMYEIPCFAEAGCDEVSIFSIPHHQELALKINARGDSRLYLVNLETQTHTQIADQLLPFRSNVVAAPDGNTLAFLKENREMTLLSPVPVAAIWGYDLITKELFAITEWQNLHREIHWIDETTLVYSRGYDGYTETWQVAIDDHEPARQIYSGNTISVLRDPARWFIERTDNLEFKYVDSYQPDRAKTETFYPVFYKNQTLLTILEAPNLRHALLIEVDTVLHQSTVTIIKSSSTITLPIPYQHFYDSIIWSSDNRYAFLIEQGIIVPIDSEQAIVFAPIPRPGNHNMHDKPQWFLAAQGH
ncbi:hypothetical protein ACP8Y2_10285 [Herpetosiphon llansteffanensis]